MNVYHLLDGLQLGGAENVALNYSIALRQLKIGSIFVGEQKDMRFLDRLKEKKIVFIGKVDFKKIAKDDVLFIHSNKQLLNCFVHKLKGQVKASRIFYVQHLQYKKMKFRLLSWIINWLCTGFIQITPITNKLVNQFINIPVEFFVNFYNSIYKKNDYVKINSVVRKELNIPMKAEVYTFSGIFRKGKGLDDFLEVYNRIQTIEKHFLIIGDGEESYLLDDYKDKKNLHWVGLQNDVERYLIASDYYLFVSYGQEMMPMALQEAIISNCNCYGYKTCINEFLLKPSNVFNSIDELVDILSSKSFEKGFYRKYDGNYGIERLEQILV